jgi:hypothetical protein
VRRYLLLCIALTLAVTAVAQLPPGFYPMHTNYLVRTIDRRQTRQFYELFHFRPIDMRTYLDFVPGEHRGQAVRRLMLNITDSFYLLEYLHDRVLAEYDRYETFDTRTDPLMRDGMRAIAEGEYETWSLTHNGQPHRLAATLSRAPDDGTGIPTEKRLVELGQEPLPKIPMTVAPAPYFYFPVTGQLKSVPRVSAVLSQVPLCRGGRIEIKGLTFPETLPNHPAAFLHSALIAQQGLLLTGIRVPDDKRPPPLSRDLFYKVKRLKAEFPDIPDFFLHPERQEFALATHVTIAAGSETLMRRYRLAYGFPREAFQPVFDAMLNRTIYWGEIPVEDFIVNTSKAITRWAGSAMLNLSTVRPNLQRRAIILACARTLRRKFVAAIPGEPTPPLPTVNFEPNFYEDLRRLLSGGDRSGD